MIPIKVLIVEDEILIAETIRMYLNERGHSVTDIAISYDEAIAAYEIETPDVVLLDVRLYGAKSGIDVAAYLTSNANKTPFVFLTSQFDKRIVQTAMSSKPQGYLTKPIQKETLWTTVELAQFHAENDEDQTEKLHIHDGTQAHVINPNEILFINSDHVYIKLNLIDGRSIMVRKSLAQIIEELDQSHFIQCHRGYIVNLKHVSSYDSSHVIIKNTKISLSRSRRTDVLNGLKKLSL